MPSTVVAHMIYNKDAKNLRVIFQSGAIYDYKKVPEDEYQSMKTSKSKGEYLNKHIKGKYRFIKIK